MRLAYLSPLPPSPSGISDYSAPLLPELARGAKLELFWDEPAFAARDFPVRPTAEFPVRYAQYDAVIYHLGNSAFHGAIYDLAVRYPGIVVLHDGTLQHFMIDRTLHRHDAAAYLREMAYSHGAAGYDAARQVVRGAGIVPMYQFPLIGRAVDNALGVVVHSQALRAAVLAADSARRDPAFVRVIPHFAFPALPPARSRVELLRALGWPEASWVVGSFGQVTPAKRGEMALRGFARLAAREPRARFLWAGDLSREYDLRPLVRELGISDRVVFTGRVAAAALPDYISLLDVAINLRFPSSGEASGPLMRLLAYGKPAIVSRIGWFAELPAAVVLPVDPGEQEEEQIFNALQTLATAPDRAAAIVTAAREYAAALTPARAAGEYLSFAEEIMRRSTRGSV